MVDLRPSKGHEQSEVRPSVILAKHDTGIAFIVPLTTKQTAKRFTFTYLVRKSQNNGLDKDSIALIFHMRSIDISKRLLQRIGELESFDLDIVKDQVALYLDMKTTQ